MQGAGGNRFAKLTVDKMLVPAGNSEAGKPHHGPVPRVKWGGHSPINCSSPHPEAQPWSLSGPVSPVMKGSELPWTEDQVPWLLQL